MENISDVITQILKFKIGQYITYLHQRVSGLRKDYTVTTTGQLESPHSSLLTSLIIIIIISLYHLIIHLRRKSSFSEFFFQFDHQLVVIDKILLRLILNKQ